METNIQKHIDEWTKAPFDTDTINEIKQLVDSNNEKELTERFYTSLEFGTGGLRGVLGAGTNRMNIYTVGMATQGLANYILKNGSADKGVIISYDSRRMSDVFAKDTASILAGNGIKAYLFDDIMPTPLCSFAIRELNALSGIMITASHNPPEYNGYKVFWDDGGQVTSPADKEIIEEVKHIDNIEKIKKADFDEAKNNGLIQIIGKDIQDAYIANLEKVVLKEKSKKSDVKVVFSPLHGAGYKIVPEVLKHFGFENINLEPEQSKPDGDFPTVSYPNPEEKETMALSVKLAKEVDADILMATDPDADRMGVGFKDKNGEYLLINGNQIGTMLEYYLLSRKKAEGTLPADGEVIKTIVTTDLQAEIAKDFGCNISNVLTGFKWIAHRMKEMEENNSGTFIFGGEESYGYLPVTFVRDKDAVAACYYFCEMADWLKSQGKTLVDFLNEIYVKYNLYLEDLKSVTLKGIEGMNKIKEIMKQFQENPPKEFAGVEVERFDDLGRLKRTYLKDNKTEDIKSLPSSNVLQYFLADGSKITMRPSGTEPKIKFYFSANQPTDESSLETAKKDVQAKIESFKDDLTKKVDAI